MISKKRALIYSIILVIVTIICTSMFQITLGNKVIISKNLYELYSKYDKLLGLENVIESEYYQKVSEEYELDGITNYKVEAIPQKIYDLYRKLVKLSKEN